MQKKLLAVAVAGALAAPAAAIAQTSVTIYGTFSTSIETRQAMGGDNNQQPAAAGGISSYRANASVNASAASLSIGGAGSAFVNNAVGAFSMADAASRIATQAAGSNFGIRVREDLGGGMAAWLQFELSTSAIGGFSPPSTAAGGQYVTARNSGLGIGSKAWGDVIYGVWDSPLNTNMNPSPVHAPYSNASTSFSSQIFGGNPLAPGTVSSFDVQALCNAGSGTFAGFTAQTCLSGAMSFHRRVPNSLQYWSPNWSGFQLKMMYADERQMAAQNVTNGVIGVGVATQQPNVIKPKLWGGSITYEAGPLYVGLGYERHDDYMAVGARTFCGTSGTCTAVSGGGAANQWYFGGNTQSLAAISVGASGINGSKDTAINFNARYTFGAFTIGGYYERLVWAMTYANLAGGDITELRKNAWGLEGAFVTGPHTIGLRYARAKDMQGTTALVGGVGGAFNSAGSGATSWIFGYGYNLSKRTSLNLYHTRTTNETNARYVGIVFGGQSPAAGGDPRYTGVGLRHTF